MVKRNFLQRLQRLYTKKNLKGCVYNILDLELDIIMIIKQLKWTITFRRTFYYLLTFIYHICACIFSMFGGFYLDQDQATRLFCLVLIFSTSLFVNVYRCNDILAGKNYGRTPPPPPKKKLSPVFIQHDTTDANLELTVYSYILRCCVYLLFKKKTFIFLPRQVPRLPQWMLHLWSTSFYRGSSSL